jgi:enamine deaminase RidA (YjgF/YER057c/UK114 family)
MSELRHVRPTGMANHPAYTHVVGARGAETLYISGQVAIDESGKTVGVGDLGAQTEQVMQNLQTALQAAGATFDDVVKITTYVVGYTPEQRAIIAEVRGKFLPQDKPPASTLVGVTALAASDWLIEIEAVAVIG